MVVTEETPVGSDSLSEWAFITDLPVSKDTAALISALGRARWRIKNEVYRTLKTVTGLEHNHRHGKQHLMGNFILLMLMAFMLDQLQMLGSEEFQAALAKEHNCPTRLWRAMREKLGPFLGRLDYLVRCHLDRPVCARNAREPCRSPSLSPAQARRLAGPGSTENRHQSIVRMGRGTAMARPLVISHPPQARIEAPDTSEAVEKRA